ncbi:hypothetical protein C2G38_2188540 [Gigaspora rosea]|uniref:Uncharacterized protein n=1 Tax=Gigaspora rosea TaxID=44941 RepID=A0A397V3J6_9GLOM|nr:hypothetical protein C2G38_2188540 [Gigaspora rosea]
MKNFIFAFILFALLLTVNAAPFQLSKRAITFEALTNDIIKHVTFLIIGYAGKDGNPIVDPYTQTFNYSIKAGTPFNISASDVPTPELPDPYTIAVGVGERFADSLFLFACSSATVGGSSEKSKIFDIYN